MTPERGGERQMKYFKITKTWSVKAESEDEAIKQVAADPGQYLDSETVTRTEYNLNVARNCLDCL